MHGPAACTARDGRTCRQVNIRFLLIHRKRVLDRFEWMDQQLRAKAYVIGDTYAVADAYLFAVPNWGKHVDVDLSGFSNLQAILGRVGNTESRRTCMKILAEAARAGCCHRRPI